MEVLESMGGNNDNFMSNIGKLKVKAFKEDSQGVASVKTVDLVVKFDIPGIIQKVKTLLSLRNFNLDCDYGR